MYLSRPLSRVRASGPALSACRVQISLNLIAVNSALVFTLLGPAWTKSKSPAAKEIFTFCTLWSGRQGAREGGGPRDAAEGILSQNWPGSPLWTSC